MAAEWHPIALRQQCHRVEPETALVAVILYKAKHMEPRAARMAGRSGERAVNWRRAEARLYMWQSVACGTSKQAATIARAPGGGREAISVFTSMAKNQTAARLGRVVGQWRAAVMTVVATTEE